MKFRVWCLSWDDTEEDGKDVERGKLGEYIRPTHDRIVDWKVTEPKDAAEVYADYCLRGVPRDGAGVQCMPGERETVMSDPRRIPSGDPTDHETIADYIRALESVADQIAERRPRSP